MGMKTQRLEQHQEQIFAHIDEEGLKAILATAVAKEERFHFDSNTKVKVIIATKDRTGSAGVEYGAEVTLTNDLGPRQA